MRVVRALPQRQNLLAGWTVVCAPAEIDVTNAGQLRAALVAAASKGPTVVVDMSQTEFCDSTGISVLNQARKRAEDDGGEVRLVITTATVLRIFTVTGIDKLFPIFTGLPDALADGPAPPAAPEQLKALDGQSGPAGRLDAASPRLPR